MVMMKEVTPTIKKQQKRIYILLSFQEKKKTIKETFFSIPTKFQRWWSWIRLLDDLTRHLPIMNYEETALS